VTAEGLVYVADSGNHRIRKFQASLVPAAAPGSAVGEAKGEEKPNLPKASPPLAGRRVNVSRERRTVTIRRPGAKRYVKLLSASSIPVGSVVNTDKGSVRLETAANLQGKRQAAVFHSGTFVIRRRLAPPAWQARPLGTRARALSHSRATRLRHRARHDLVHAGSLRRHRGARPAAGSPRVTSPGAARCSSRPVAAISHAPRSPSDARRADGHGPRSGDRASGRRRPCGGRDVQVSP